MSAFHTIELSDPLYEHGGLRALTLKSPALRGRGDVTLFVPPGGESMRDLPLVILLHGVHGSHWAWTLKGGAHRTAGNLIARGEIAPVVLAMPSDGLWGDGSGYLPHPAADYEAWIMRDVVGCAREVLPCLGSGSPLFLAGLSMGGFGALRLGAKYAALVAGISAHSSLTHARQLRSFVEEPLAAYGVVDDGDETLGAMYWLRKNRAHLPPLRFDCGRQDSLLDANRRLHAELLADGIAHEYAEFEGGHSWDYWREHLADTLRFFDRRLPSRFSPRPADCTPLPRPLR